MGRRYDAVVIGAGIVGASCAFELHNAGLTVLVLDSHTVGSGATAACMGHLVAMDDSPAQLALTVQSQRLWAKLASSLPTNCDYTNCGTLWIAADDQEMATVSSKHSLYSESNIPCEIYDSKALYKAEPALRPGLTGALFVSADSVVYPTLCAQFLLESIELREQSSVSHIRPGEVHLQGGAVLESDHIIVAAGTASPALLPDIPISSRKGHLAITDRYPGLVNHQLIELAYLKSAHSLTKSESIAFNVQPRANGQILIGSSREFAGLNRSINDSILSRMLNRACEYLPMLGELNVLRCWTGFRPCTPDSLPLIGPWPDLPGVYVAAGHEGLGITSSLVTGHLIAHHICQSPALIDPKPYLPTRIWEARDV
jgi:D-hydroxyproline dehydrogenase subunit beta